RGKSRKLSGRQCRSNLAAETCLSPRACRIACFTRSTMATILVPRSLPMQRCKQLRLLNHRKPALYQLVQAVSKSVSTKPCTLTSWPKWHKKLCEYFRSYLTQPSFVLMPCFAHLFPEPFPTHART